MKFNDLVLGAILIVFGAVVVVHVGTFPEMGGMEYGPAFFPRLIGVAFILIGGAMAIGGIAARRSGGAPVTLPAWGRDPVAILRVVAVIGAIVLFVLLAPVLGFLLTTGVLTLALLLIMGARWIIAVPLALILPIGLHYGFAVALRVPLPRGLIEQTFM
ncbi:tripartite tricarboxylate transporter TctB family protein [Bauldia sp.]|uniref:tripartite tricarboxylate transporter TctB family protein n=1 Tax=Bauldia sp. TaxID=2575872 RepID=UPI003BA8E4BB